LYTLAKEETVRSEPTELGEVGDNATHHSPKGRMKVQAMIRRLGWLRELLDDQDGEKRIYRVLVDIYRVH
jgi:hypothetical protein